jgi:PIN domain
MATVFVDTNFFLQLRDPAELPWAEVSGERELFVMVPRVVQGEIDKLKQDGSSRRSKRARRASSLLRRVIHSADATLVVREANPRVLLGFPPPVAQGITRPSTLDPLRADDQIVAEILDYSVAHPSEDVFLLTNDTGPMLTARYHNVRFVAVPESWLLEPEPDERDKTIQDLKRRLDALERTHPILEISAWKQDRQINALEEEIPLFETLPERIIDQLVEEIGDRCPMSDEFGLSGTELLFRRTAAVGLGRHCRYTQPTEDEIRKYREVDYPDWLKRVKEFLVDAPRRLNGRTHSTNIQLRIRNSGTVPANNAVVEFEAGGDVFIQAAPESRGHTQQGVSTDMRLPRPPEPPSGHFDETHSGLSAASGFGLSSAEAMLSPTRKLPAERNRNTFYWAVRPLGPAKLLSLTCEEVRHGNDAEEFSIIVVFSQSKSTSGVVSCKFSATNLPEPSKFTIPIKTLVSTADIENHLRNLIIELPRRVRVGPIEGLSFEL